MRSFIVAVLLFVGLAGCRKEHTLVVVPPLSTPMIRPDSGAIPTFQINNVVDRFIYHHPFGSNNKAEWFLDIEKQPDSTIPLSLEVVHTNPFFAASTTAYSNGTWMMHVYDEGAANGVYNFILNAQTGSQPVVTYPFKVTIEGNLSCAGFLTDLLFDAYGYIPASTNYPNMRFQNSLPASDTLLLTGFRDYKTLKVIPNCRAGAFLVPGQQIGDTIYRGTGTVLYDQQPGTTKIELHILEESGSWSYIVDYVMISK